MKKPRAGEDAGLGEDRLLGGGLRWERDYFLEARFSSMAAWAAARRATGTR